MYRYRSVVGCAIFLLWSSAAEAQTKTTWLTEPVTAPASYLDSIGFDALAMSADGNIVVFVSGRANLVPGDTNAGATTYGADVFVRDVAAGVTRRILGVGGAQPDGDASSVALTRDGRYVFFMSTASNLVPADPNGAFTSTFRHDLVTGITAVLNMPAAPFTISGNGRYVAYFFGNTKLLDLQTGTTSDFLEGSNLQFSYDGGVVTFSSGYIIRVYEGGVGQVFVGDPATGTYELISRSPDGLPGNALSGFGNIAISDDGRYVAFASLASNLVANDTNGVSDVFLHDRVTQTITRVSLTAAGAQRTVDSTSPAISSNGEVIAFESSVPAACSECPPLAEVAVYDRNFSNVQKVSVSTDGTPSNAPGGGVSYGRFAVDYTGRYVAFVSSAGNLAPGDRNNLGEDVFLRDRGATPGCLYLVSPTVIDVGSGGGTGTVTISTMPGCGWSSAIADSWVTTATPTGTGPSVVSVSIGANAGIGRFGYLSFEGWRLLVRQPGALASAPPQFEPVGVAPNGAPFARGTFVAAISGEGRYVAFLGSTNFSPSYGEVTRVYLRDRSTGQTVDVSRAPGGPPDVAGIPHVMPGTPSAELGVPGVNGSVFSADGRFVYFTAAPECFLYDRESGTSSKLPSTLGNGGAGCPSMEANGRYFTGIVPGTKTVTLFDRITQQTATFPFPGIPTQDFVSSVISSLTARYLLARVTEPDQVREYTILLDRATGLTARTGPNLAIKVLEQVRARLQLLDPIWTEFGLNRYYTRDDDIFAGCELVDRQTGGQQALPLLKTLAKALGCGIAVNNGQQVIFSSAAELSPGDLYQGTSDLHVYTLLTGTAARIGSRMNGDNNLMDPIAVSQNGRYLVTLTTSGSYPVSGAVVNVVVFDLGVGSTVPVDGTAPRDLQAVVSGTTVVLSWNAPTEAVPASYVVQAGSAPGASNLAVLDTGATATTLTAVAPPGIYYVRVRGHSGGIIGSASNEVIVNVPGGCVAPPTPVGVTHSVTGTSVTLSWQQAVGASQYVIEAGSSVGLSNLAMFDTGSSATTFSTSAPVGTYFVRVRARNACGTSPPSNETVVVVGGGCPTPSRPTSLTGSVSGAVVTLGWGPAAGAVVGYILEAGSSSGASDLAQVNVGAGTSLTAAAPAGTYYVRIRAMNSCGVGPPSNEAVVTVR